MNEKRRIECMAEAVIKIDSVSKSFSTRLVLDGIDLDISKGDSVCICGVNGAGKSTLLRIIAGLLQPDKGVVFLNGQDVSGDLEQSKLQLGLISHKSMVYPDLTVFENLSFFANLYGVSDCNARVNELIEDVSLGAYRYDRANVLSRGLLQRLSIARALVHRPGVLLADEPFTGLDSEACRHLVSVLADFTAKSGTVIMTTHNINSAIECCNRIVVLDKAKLIFDAEIEDLEINSFTRDYLSYARDKT